MRTRLVLVLLFLCLGVRAHALRMAGWAEDAYNMADFVLQVVVEKEWSPELNAEGRKRNLNRYDPEVGTFFHVSVERVFKAPAGGERVEGVVIYVEDANVICIPPGPQLQVGKTYIVFLERAKIDRLLARFYDIPPGSVWSQIKNYEFDPHSKRSVSAHDSLLAIFRYKKLLSDKERRETIRDILRNSDSRMLLGFAIGETWRRDLQLKHALKEAGERLLDRDAPLALRALVLYEEQGGAVESTVLRQLFGRRAEFVPCAALQLVGQDDVDAFKHTIGEMLKSRDHAKCDAAIKKLAELRPSYLEKAVNYENIRVLIYYTATQELRKRGYEFKLPLRFEPVLDLPNNLAVAICEAYDGNLSRLRFSFAGASSRNYSFGQWAKGLQLVEFRLNDPDERRAAAVVSAFRSCGIPLKLVEGRYHPVSYEKQVEPPVTLEINLADHEFRVGDSMPIEVVERAARAGQRICFDGQWRILVSGPGGSTGHHVDDKSDGEPEYVRLKAGDCRTTKVASYRFREPGRYTISVLKTYCRDDRNDGGAWTGATTPATVEIEVAE